MAEHLFKCNSVSATIPDQDWWNDLFKSNVYQANMNCICRPVFMLDRTVQNNKQNLVYIHVPTPYPLPMIKKNAFFTVLSLGFSKWGPRYLLLIWIQPTNFKVKMDNLGWKCKILGVKESRAFVITRIILSK